MSKRLIAILLILLAALGIAAVIYWATAPLRSTVGSTEQQPPPLTSTAPSNIPKAPTTPTVIPEPKADSPEFAERKAVEEVKRTSKGIVERVGSYGNVDGFQSIRNSYKDVSTEVRTYLDGVRAQLAKDHPFAQGSWSQTTRVVTTNLATSSPIRDKNAVELTLDVQQSQESVGKAENSYARYSVKLERRQGIWIVTHIESQPIEP